MVIHVCARCEVQFEHKNRRRRYCSRACYAKVQRARRTAKYLTFECVACGETFERTEAYARKYNTRFCSQRCGNAVKARESAQQRADKLRDHGRGPNGECTWYRKVNGRHEHRVVAEQMIGRPLRRGEVVHHRDEDKRNNDPANLEVLPSQSTHIRRHIAKWRNERAASEWEDYECGRESA